VLAFGNASVDGLPSKSPDKAAAQQAQRNEQARTAVLAVPVDDVNRLTIGDASGRLMLALRNPTDMAQPDPKLFAELPTALQPPQSTKTGEPRRAPLEGLDRAQAGLTAADLVTGGKGPTVRPPVVETRAVAGGTRAAGTGQRAGLQVEVIRGERSETVNY
jgi:pilus assembly protein CpaB